MKRPTLLALLTVITINVGCSSSSNTASEKTTADGTTQNAADKKEKTAPKSDWVYEITGDRMSSDSVYFVTLDSKDILDFKFPYQGGSTPTIGMRKTKKEMDIMIFVSKGQFMSHMQDGSVKVRFDEEEAFDVPTARSSDGSSKVLFLQNEKKIYQKILNSKTMIIQAEFYNEGLRTMEFKTEGLKQDFFKS